MSLRNRFAKFAKQQEEMVREWERTAQEQYQKDIQLLDKVEPLVKRVCKEFAKVLHWGFHSQRECSKDLGLVCCRYWIEPPSRDFILVILNVGGSSFYGSPRAVTLRKTTLMGDLSDESVSIPLEKLTEENLAEALERFSAGFVRMFSKARNSR